MKRVFESYLHQLKRSKAKRRRLAGMICVLSLVVSMAVFWQLRIVGITMSDVPCCGKEEHVHTEECLGKKVLICGLEEAEPELICTIPEHQHTDECYEIRKVQICEKPEHTHTDDCYEITEELVCTEDHVHTEECYKTTRTLKCGLEEHTHGDACFEEQKVLKCELQEHTHGEGCYTPGHKHTEECWKQEYVCGKEEHTHTILCYSDPNADVESSAEWEASVPQKLSGNWAQDLLKVANSQMGYTESTRNFQLAEDGTTEKGYTRYGAWYGAPYSDWGTTFVSFCLRYAGIPESAMPRVNGAYALSGKLQEMGLYIVDAYDPKPGDVVLLKLSGAENPNASAVVTGMGKLDDQPAVAVIQGDLDNQVKDHLYLINSGEIAGYCSMTAVYERAVEKGIVNDNPATDPADNTTVSTEPSETTEATEAAEPEDLSAATPEQLDARLKETLTAFNDQAAALKALAEEEKAEKAPALMKELDGLYAMAEKIHCLRYPDAAEGDFAAYLSNNYPEAVETYLASRNTVPEQTEATEETQPAPVDDAVLEALGQFPVSAAKFTAAEEKQDPEAARAAKLEMDQAYKTARDLYLKQYPEKTEADFAAYVNTVHAGPASVYETAKAKFPGTKTDEQVLDEALQTRLSAFDDLAKRCDSNRGLGNDNEAKAQKLQLDQLLAELRQFHMKRFPNATEEDFRGYLANNIGKALERYTAAAKAFPETVLKEVATVSDPILGHAQNTLTLSTMNVDVTVTGSAMFPEKKLQEVVVTPEGTVEFTGPVTDATDASGSETAASSSEAEQTTATAAATAATTAPATEAAASTAASTEAVTEASTQASTEAATEASTEASTEAATETSTEASTEAATEASTEASTEAATEETVDPTEETVPEETKPELPANTDPRWDAVEVKMDPMDPKDAEAFLNYISVYHPDAYSATAMNLQPIYNQKNLEIADMHVALNIQITDPEAAEDPDAGIMPIMETLFGGEETQPTDAFEQAADEGYLLSIPALDGQKKESEQKITSAAAAGQKEDPKHHIVVLQNYKGTVLTVGSEIVSESDPDFISVNVDLIDNDVEFNDAMKQYNNDKPLHDVSKPAPSTANTDFNVGSSVDENGNIVIVDTPLTAADKENSFKPVNPPSPIYPDSSPEKYLNNARAYPETWDSELLTLDGSTFDSEKAKNDAQYVSDNALILRKDPYFTFVSKDAASGFDRPSATLGYVMSNYNVFVRSDAIVRHIVGSSAIQGDAYYTGNQGGTGAGYIPIPNTAPTYVKGRLMHYSLGSDSKEPQELTSQAIKDATHTPQTVNILNGSVHRMPCYFGTVNKGKIQTVLNQATQKSHPYYLTDHYINFEDFFKDIDSNKIRPEATPRHKLKYSERETANLTLEKDGVQWGKDSNKQGIDLLFVKMGTLVDIDKLDNVQIVLYPYDGFQWPPELIPPAGSNPNAQARAGYLCTASIDTAIRCDQKGVVSPYHGQTGTIAYYTGDPGKPLETTAVCNASLANIHGYSSSSMIFFPEAEEVHISLSATHVIAPKAKVKTFQGDYYGCLVCNKLRASGDLHMLPYKHGTIEAASHKLNKRILNEDGSHSVPDATQTFNFSVSPKYIIPYNHKTWKPDYNNVQSWTSDSVKTTAGSEVVGAGKKEYKALTTTLTNTGDEIDITPFNQKVEAWFNALQNYSSQFVNTNNAGIHKAVYVFELKEVGNAADNTAEFTTDPHVYYLAYFFKHEDAFDAHFEGAMLYPPQLSSQQPLWVWDAVRESPRPVNLPEPVGVPSIVFYNQPILGGPELPSTGGIGVLPVTLAGLAFTSIPLALRSKKHSKKTQRKERR